MKAIWFMLAVVAVLVVAFPARAHHPGADLDKVMGSKEQFFQPIDKPAPAFRLAGADGKMTALSDFSDKVVVLHFVYAGCPDVCPLHAEKLAAVQAMVNESPMKELVRFVSVTTDPGNDTPDILRAYGPAHGLDPATWTFLTTSPQQNEDATRALAESFGHTFKKTADGFQAHGVVTHIIDRDGRWAANFHGLRFAPVNMVLYINGLINNANTPGQKPERDWWDDLKELF